MLVTSRFSGQRAGSAPEVAIAVELDSPRDPVVGHLADSARHGLARQGCSAADHGLDRLHRDGRRIEGVRREGLRIAAEAPAICRGELGAATRSRDHSSKARSSTLMARRSIEQWSAEVVDGELGALPDGLAEHGLWPAQTVRSSRGRRPIVRLRLRRDRPGRARRRAACGCRTLPRSGCGLAGGQEDRAGRPIAAMYLGTTTGQLWSAVGQVRGRGPLKGLARRVA
jgi:hypothetical protein